MLSPLPRLSPAILSIAGATLLSCVAPSDDSDRILVTIEAPATLLVRGRTMVLTAHAWKQDEKGTRTEVPGAAFHWESVRGDLATVEGRDDGTALVTPVNEGIAEIRAQAAAFEEATSASVELRVADPLVIDSIRPRTVRYGEQVTLFGVGLGEVLRTSLGQADLLPDSASFSGEPQGLGRRSYWVPYPAQTDRLVAISRRGSITVAAETTTVKPQDLYHENQAPPPVVDLDGEPVRGLDTLFYNPALALVPGEGTDALQFRSVKALGSLTFTISSTGPVVALFEPVLTADRNLPTGFPTDRVVDTWALGFSGQYCDGSFISLGRSTGVTTPVTLVRALKDLPVRDLLLGIYGNPPGAYTVTVRSGYVTADPRIAPDRFEENDFCSAADSNANNPDLGVVLPFSDTLTIDNPFEADWFQFEAPGDPESPEESLMTIRTAARPFGATDSSNLGLVLVAANFDFGERARIVAQARTAGSDETLTALVPGGTHYILVVDDGGVATRYSLCVAAGSSCTFLEARASSEVHGPATGNRGRP